MARRWVCTFGLPQTGDVSSVSGLATSWNRDASYVPLGQEGSPSALDGLGFAFRRGNFGSTNYVTQDFSQGGLSPTTNSTCGLEFIRMRIRRYPTTEEQFYSLTNTGGGAFILGTVTVGGEVRFYNNNGGFPGTLLFTIGFIPLNTWVVILLRYVSLGAGGGGVPPALRSFECLNPSYGTSVSVPSFPFVRSLLGAEGRVGVANGMEIDFADWALDDLGNPADATAVDGTHGETLDQRTLRAAFTFNLRGEVRRPQGLGTYQNWVTSGILAYQARQGIPPDSTAGGGINILTSNTSGAKVSYLFGSPIQMAIPGVIRAIRLAVYMAAGSGTHQLIFRRNGVDTLFPVTGNSNSWLSVVMDTADTTIFPILGLNPNDVIEVGIQKDPSGNPSSIQSVLLELETDNNPIPTTLITPTDDTIQVAVGQYTGNGTVNAVTVGFPPDWISIVPIAGVTGDGMLWCDQDVGSPGHTDTRVIGTRMCSLQQIGFTVAGTDALCNQAGSTYQWVAVRDPQMRALMRGTITHSTTDATAVNPYAKAGFVPAALWAKILKWNATAGTGSGYYRGPGHTATFASPLAAAEGALSINAIGPTAWTSAINLHQPTSGNVGTTYTGWRSDTFYGNKRWNTAFYTGDGTGARSIAVDLSGMAPLWVLLVPHNGASYIRVPGMVCGQSYLVGTSSLTISTNGVTGGGPNAVTVAGASNTLGVVYDLLVLAGSGTTDACGFTVSPPPGTPPTVFPPDAPPVTPPPAGGGGTIGPLPPTLPPGVLCYTLAQALTDLGNRLGDPGFVHWTQAELTKYIREGLRVYNAYTAHYRNQGSFVTQTGEPFYDLPTQLPTLRAYNVTDAELIGDIEYSLMEPPTPTAWTGTAQFILQDLIDGLQRRRDQFLRETGAVLLREITAALTPSVPGRVPLAANVIDLRRVSWTMANGTVIPLRREDEWGLTNFRRNWRTPQVNLPEQWPTVYSVGVTPPLTLQIAPPPDAAGTLDTLAILVGAALNPATPVKIGVPDDWSWVVKFGALADLLSREGPCYDPQRAAYCEARWQLGLKMATLAPVVLAAQISGASVRTQSLGDTDAFRRNWQTIQGTPRQVLLAGQNVAGVSPPPSAGHNVTVTLDVVANMPVPSAAGDCINLGIDLSVLDSLYDYVEHLALFKEGPGQLDASMALYERFARACGITKQLEQAQVPKRGPIVQQTLQETRSVPHLLPPEEPPA